jgi:hypothetical protein
MQCNALKHAAARFHSVGGTITAAPDKQPHILAATAAAETSASSLETWWNSGGGGSQGPVFSMPVISQAGLWKKPPLLEVVAMVMAVVLRTSA